MLRYWTLENFPVDLGHEDRHVWTLVQCGRGVFYRWIVGYVILSLSISAGKENLVPRTVGEKYIDESGRMVFEIVSGGVKCLLL